jgi:hypothetical protein
MGMYFGRPDTLRAIASAVPLYGDKEFQSPTRSTIPMLSLLIHDRAKFDEILTCIGFPTNFGELFLEYTVSPQLGRGKASHTDVMLKAGIRSLAIEAKWTEPMYETVRKWLGGDPAPANKLLVLNGWLKLLNRHAAAPVRGVDCHDLIYQMVHRAASAVRTGQEPSLAYFVFKPSPAKNSATPDQIYRKLSDLWTRLGRPPTFRFHLVEISTTPMPAYSPLRGLSKRKETSEAVSEALQGEAALFTFGQVTHRLVGADV